MGLLRAINAHRCPQGLAKSTEIAGFGEAEVLFQVRQALLQAPKKRGKEQSRCRRSQGGYSDYVTHGGNWGRKLLAFGAGAEGTILPGLMGQQEEEEQERKQCPKCKSQSRAVPHPNSSLSARLVPH